MDQLTKIIMQSNKRMDAILAGKYDRNATLDAQREAEIQIKAVTQYIQIFAVSAKNSRTLGTLSKKNIMDGFSAIPISNNGYVVCPEKDVSISMEECLDFSGSHLNECGDCDHFSISRAVIMDTKPGGE